MTNRPLIDTHCHLNLAEFFPDPDPVVERAKEAGVAGLVMVGLDVQSSQAAIDLAERHDGVWATAGFHPNHSASYRKEDQDEIRRLLQHPKVVAIGEVGLDNHWDYATKEQQEACLRDHLDLAKETGKPVVLHCREAYPRLLDIVEGEQGVQFLFHCFAGDAAEAVRAASIGSLFGVDGPITYKKNTALRELVRDVPPGRLLLETDSPFLPPEPYRGKPNEPALLPYVNRGLAGALGVTEEECAQATTSAAEAFFGVKVG